MIGSAEFSGGMMGFAPERKENRELGERHRAWVQQKLGSMKRIRKYVDIAATAAGLTLPVGLMAKGEYVEGAAVYGIAAAIGNYIDRENMKEQKTTGDSYIPFDRASSSKSSKRRNR